MGLRLPAGLLLTAAVAAVVLTVALHLTSDDEEAALLTPTRQDLSAVPASARPAEGPLEFGHIEHALGPEPDISEARTLEVLRCEGDLITIGTNQETVYARMPCERFLPAEIVEALVGRPAAVFLEAGEMQRLKIISTEGSAEFTVEGVWVEER